MSAWPGICLLSSALTVPTCKPGRVTQRAHQLLETRASTAADERLIVTTAIDKMPARPSAPPRDRDYDFSNVGKVGRRTGVTLPPRDLDEHGLESMSGMFSSPRKPSPATDRRAIIESVEEVNGG